MNLESNPVGLALGVLLLVACGALLPGRRRGAAVGSILLGTAIGAVTYPLALCLFMGLAAARSVPQGHGWVRFQFAFSTYAQSAPGESIPRGAVLGAFVALSWGFWRHMRARRQRDPGA